VTYLGTELEQKVNVVPDGVELDGDGMVDIKLASLDLLELKMAGGDDAIDALTWDRTSLKMFGGSGDDQISGGKLGDLISGGPGLNVLDGGEGIDLLSEEVSFKYSKFNSYELKMLEDVPTFRSTGDQLTESKVFEFEAVELKFDDAGYKMDASTWDQTTLKLTGGAGADVFLGGLKADEISGLGGDDLLSGGAGLNKLDGGDGFDSLLETLNVSWTLGENKMVGSDGSVSEFTGIESAKVLLGDGENKIDATDFPFPVVLDGGPGNDTLIGSKVGDILLGGDGADSVNGGDGDDTVSGGSGNDSILGGAGIDLLSEEGDVYFRLTATSLSGLGKDVLSGIENAFLKGGPSRNRIDAAAFKMGQVTLFGLGGNDTLIGGDLLDLLFGGDGNDSLSGTRGDDGLFGGPGDDLLDGGQGRDSGDGGDGIDRCVAVEFPTNCEF